MDFRPTGGGTIVCFQKVSWSTRGAIHFLQSHVPLWFSVGEEILHTWSGSRSSFGSRSKPWTESTKSRISKISKIASSTNLGPRPLDPPVRGVQFLGLIPKSLAIQLNVFNVLGLLLSLSSHIYHDLVIFRVLGFVFEPISNSFYVFRCHAVQVEY